MIKSPIVQTLLMGLVAAATSILAAWFFPWPEMVTRSDLVGKPLFESFEAGDVRSILVTQFDPQTNELKQLEIRRSGQNWVIPTFQNYTANNREQISLAVNSVNVSVLEQRSSEPQDHVEYGVIDPVEFETSVPRNSLGSRIVMRDRNNSELADMIVGAAPTDQSNIRQTRRFVRITGDPRVFVAEVPAAAVTADFFNWVDTNLLQIGAENPGDRFQVNSYRKEGESLGNPDAAVWNYQLSINLLTQNQEFRVPDSRQKLQAIPFAEENESYLNLLGNTLGRITFTDVRRKPRALSNILKNPQAEISAALDALKEAGFAVVGLDADRKFGLVLSSLMGELKLRFADGVEVSLLVGISVEGTSVAGSQVHHLVMLYASFDPNFFPAIEEVPADADDPTKRAYLRSVEERDAKIERGTSRAQSLNDSYADWYFVVPEVVINALLPPLRVPPPEEIVGDSAEANQELEVSEESQNSEGLTDSEGSEDSRESDSRESEGTTGEDETEAVSEKR